MPLKTVILRKTSDAWNLFTETLNDVNSIYHNSFSLDSISEFISQPQEMKFFHITYDHIDSYIIAVRIYRY